jgi:hypothetical protein
MTLDVSLLTRPCTIEHRTQVGPPDDYGTPTDVIVTEDVLCEVQQRSRNESEGMAEVGIEQWFLCLPPFVSVTTLDRVVIDGLRYEFVGPPWPVRHPRTGAASHVECTVKRTE